MICTNTNQEGIIMTIVTRIQEITVEIQGSLDTIQTESIRVGGLLREVLDLMKDEGKKQPEFLEYCKLNFSIAKTQAYRLMKIAEFFEDDKRFSGVAMRVLYALATEANEEQLEKAAELAANDSLNTGTLNAILYPEPVVKQEPGAPKQTPEEQQEQQEEINNSLNNVPVVQSGEGVGDAPFDLGENEAPRTVDEVVKATDSETQAVIEGQRKEIETLNEMLKSLTSQLQELTAKSERKPKAPFLPQFRNACPYAVLGLSQVEATKKTVVAKAFRELIKCGYGDGHEAFELLVKAKDQLLADIKASK